LRVSAEAVGHAEGLGPRDKVVKKGATFPARVVLIASKPRGEAVLLQLEMSRKNHYSTIVFLDRHGHAEIDGSNLLRQFREDLAAFPMDYVDPVAGFTGKITAVSLRREEIGRALAAYRIYKNMLTFPEGYLKALLKARRRVTGRRDGKVRTEQRR
jgi:hypothetical protein